MSLIKTYTKPTDTHKIEQFQFPDKTIRVRRTYSYAEYTREFLDLKDRYSRICNNATHPCSLFIYNLIISEEQKTFIFEEEICDGQALAIYIENIRKKLAGHMSQEELSEFKAHQIQFAKSVARQILDYLFWNKNILGIDGSGNITQKTILMRRDGIVKVENFRAKSGSTVFPQLKEITEKDDIWDLGKILYCIMVGGDSGFGEFVQKGRSSQFTDNVMKHWFGVFNDAGLAYLAFKCLTIDPGRRPNSGELLSFIFMCCPMMVPENLQDRVFLEHRKNLVPIQVPPKAYTRNTDSTGNIVSWSFNKEWPDVYDAWCIDVAGLLTPYNLPQARIDEIDAIIIRERRTGEIVPGKFFGALERNGLFSEMIHSFFNSLEGINMNGKMIRKITSEQRRFDNIPKTADCNAQSTDGLNWMVANREVTNTEILDALFSRSKNIVPILTRECAQFKTQARQKNLYKNIIKSRFSLSKIALSRAMCYFCNGYMSNNYPRVVNRPVSNAETVFARFMERPEEN